MNFQAEIKRSLSAPAVKHFIVLMLSTSFILALGLSPDELSVSAYISRCCLLISVIFGPLIAGLLATQLFYSDQNERVLEIVHTTPIDASVSRIVALFVLVYFICSFIFLFSVPLAGVSKGLNLKDLIAAVGLSSLFFFPSSLALICLCIGLVRIASNSLSFGALLLIAWASYLLLSFIIGSPLFVAKSASTHIVGELFNWVDPFGVSTAHRSLQLSDSALSPASVGNRVLIAAAAIIYLLVVGGTVKTNRTVDIKEATSVKKGRVRDGWGFAQTKHGRLLTMIFALSRTPAGVVLSLFWLTVVSVAFYANLTPGTDIIVYSRPTSSLGLTSNFLMVFNFILIVILSLWVWMIVTYETRVSVNEVIASTPVRIQTLQITNVLCLTTLLFGLLICFFATACFISLMSGVSFEATQLVRGVAPLIISNWLLAVAVLLLFGSWSSKALVFVCGVILMSSRLGLLDGLSWFELANLKAFLIPSVPFDSLISFQHVTQQQMNAGFCWFAVLLALAAYALNYGHRGTFRTLTEPKSKAVVTGFSAASVILLMAYQYYYALQESPFSQQSVKDEWRADYERLFSSYQGGGFKVDGLDVNIDIDSKSGSIQGTARYSLINLGDSTLDRILISQPPNGVKVSVPERLGKLMAISNEETTGLYELSSVVAPGGTISIDLDFSFERPKKNAQQFHLLTTPSFSYLRSTNLLPSVGYRPELELSDNGVRDTYGLPVDRLSRDQGVTRQRFDRINAYTTTISVDSGYVGISQGRLADKWESGGRKFYRYETGSPIRNLQSWVAAPFNVVSSRVDEVDLHVYLPPEMKVHNRHFQAMKSTLDWFEKHLEPYPFESLSIVAMPELQGVGYSLPYITLLGTNYGFNSEASVGSALDPIFRTIVHETAHQWFGHVVGSGFESNSSFLTESLTQYIELLVIEESLGEDARDELIDWHKRNYQAYRSNSLDDETQLLTSENHYEIYSRSTLVFNELRGEIGDAPIIGALRDLLEHQIELQEHVTASDFLHYLKQRTGEESHGLIDGYFL